MRIFEEKIVIENNSIYIPEKSENFHHIYNVLRVKKGEIIEVVCKEERQVYITRAEEKGRLRHIRKTKYRRKNI